MSKYKDLHNIFSPDKPSPHGELHRYITVKNDYIGFHSYPGAPDEVAFLKNTHRHKFFVQSTVGVLDQDREIEFFMMQEFIEREVIPFISLRELGSCEMQAERILWALVNKYGDHREVFVSVSEDNENQGEAHYVPRNHL